MLLPKIQTFDGRLEAIDTFRGLNRAEKIEEGEWNDELNLTSDRYPMLSVRKKRKVAMTINGFVCSMLAHGEDFYFLVLPNTYITDASAVSNTAKQVTLYKNSMAVATFSFDTANDQYPGRMIIFGAYIIIPGIKAWYNTADGTSGSIDAAFGVTFDENNTYWTFTIYPVDENGKKLTIKASLSPEEAEQQEAEDPQTYQYGECYVIPSTKTTRQYNGNSWRTVETGMRIEGSGINAGFEAGDTVEFKDWSADPLATAFAHFMDALSLNGYQKIQDAGTDYVVLKDKYFWATSGVQSFTAQNLGTYSPRIERLMPDMDYVIACNNRLWGCKYGTVDGKQINELYASELGSFKIWRNYDGTSMASWAASCGTDGPWTGAINYKGSPYFFKEKHVHKVYVSATGAHQVIDSQIKGVRRSWSIGDCSDSLCEFDGYLYWLSNDGICRYDGSRPVIISEALGDISRVYSACIGGTEGKLYVEITSLNEAGTSSQNDFYSYDVKRGIWHRENSPLQNIDYYVEFAKSKEAFYVCQAGHGNLPGYHSTAITTDVFDFTPTSTTNLESSVSYSCTSGLIGWQETPQKYISRMDLRLILPAGATLKVEIEYDSDGTWRDQGTVTGGTGGGTGSVMFPVRPHRCDHFRIRLSGTGEMRLYSIAKRLTKGSDVVR